MSIIKSLHQLGDQWITLDPFLMCVRHVDRYPVANEDMAPDVPRELLEAKIDAATGGGANGASNSDQWRMYHGSHYPGFPAHPHRGFETITLIESGFVDHADSLGAAARYGPGDVQWITAGSGIQHSEMFPLMSTENENPLELFQIWLNLPASSKMVQPQFSLLWADSIPEITLDDAEGRKTHIRVIAGSMANRDAPSPPPHSWASDNRNGVSIWQISMQPRATWELPECEAGVNRCLYFYDGQTVTTADTALKPDQAVELHEGGTLLRNGHKPARLLYLQGKPINEPVANRGPFVMNTNEEVARAISEYKSNGFGQWPWPSREFLHPRSKSRFALHINGVEETREL